MGDLRYSLPDTQDQKKQEISAAWSKLLREQNPKRVFFPICSRVGITLT